jgi:hypothetical protein
MAQAAEPGGSAGYYDRDRIMGSSAVFVGLNTKQVGLIGPLESAMKRMDGALASLDLGVALTGGAIDTAHRELWAARLDERAGSFSSFFDAFQERFDAEGSAYERVFLAALERAVSALAAELGSEVVECSGGGGDPFAMSGPGGLGSSRCEGDDLSARIAVAWDKDPALAEDLAALDTQAWPEITSYESQETALARLEDGATDGGLDGWLDPARLVRSLPEAAELLDAVARRTEQGRRELLGQSRMIDRESDSAEAELASIRERAKGVRLSSEAAKAALGSALWQALGRVNKKSKALRGKNIGVCMNPADWGACSGPDLTFDVRDALLSDRKLQKGLARQLAALPDSALTP